MSVDVEATNVQTQLTESMNGMTLDSGNSVTVPSSPHQSFFTPESRNATPAPAISDNANSINAVTDPSTFDPQTLADFASLTNIQPNHPLDYFGRPFQIHLPLNGFAVLFRISRYVYGIVDPQRTIHSVHAAQLRQFITFAYRCFRTPNEPVFMPIGYREFVQYLHTDPIQMAHLAELDEGGHLLARPNISRFPLDVNFPNDRDLEEALEMLSAFGNYRNMKTVNSVILDSASRKSRRAPYPTRGKPSHHVSHGANTHRHASNSFGIAGGRM
ncbi:hypothetical protein CPB84DRAFT_1893314 [Gymnopilus junonius]|uniref:Uncharacterized protein n=1 Tax=Gymnopilus junonius TaxID=109634 RepID=A0A9P5TGA7_GYMJU|nr:hypothetical protein CPB84DRAFT_1893314 [Gymnopilus junonius]